MTPTWLLAHPRARPGENAPDIYSIDACTTLVNGEPQVELQIFLSEFDASWLMAVPRLLVHELICHVHAHDDAIDNRSVWAEGVMDWTATKLWEEWCTNLALSAGPSLTTAGRLALSAILSSAPLVTMPPTTFVSGLREVDCPMR